MMRDISEWPVDGDAQTRRQELVEIDFGSSARGQQVRLSVDENLANSELIHMRDNISSIKTPES